MSKYRLIKLNHLPYQFEKDGEIIANIDINFLSLSGYDFKLLTSNGESYILKSTGLFFWRKILLFRCEKEYAQFTKYKCKSLKYDLSRTLSGDIYVNDEILCTTILSRVKKNIDLEVSWEMNNDEIEYLVLTLIIIGIQNRI